jgi:PAS domain S-box-containing protein
MLTILVSAACAAGLIYVAERTGLSDRYAIYVLSLVSVGLAAYAWVNPAPSLLLVAFFESILIWQFYLDWRANGFTEDSVQLAVIAVSVIVVVPLMSGMAGMLKARRRLSDAVSDLDALLVRSADLREVFSFLLAHMRRLGAPDTALIIYRNPGDGSWQLISQGEPMVLGWLPAPGEGATEPLTLVTWLTGCDESVMVGDLGGDPRFAPGSGEGALVSAPVHEANGGLRAVLVISDPRPGALGRDHLAALTDLAALAEKALPQAGLYALADQALARRAGQLAALQRAAKELNAALDIDRIAELALDCALALTRGDAGLTHIALPGLAPTLCVAGARRDDARIAAGVARVAALQGPVVDSPELQVEPVLLSGCAARLLAPIQRDGRHLGALIVESRRPTDFDDQDLGVVRSLTDHVAVALANAHLFEEIQGERRKTGQIIETMADGLLVADESGAVMAFNPAAEMLTGWRRENAFGRQLCDVLGCDSGQSCSEECRLIGVLHGGGVLRDERRTIRTRDGSRRVVSLSASTAPLNGALRQGLVVLARDVTDREEIEAFERELVATFSHDLRAPLTNISVLVDMLANSGLETGQINAEYLNSLRAQSRRLTDLVERTLDLSRMDAGQWALEPRPVPIPRLLEEIASMWREAARDRRILFDPPAAPLWAWADERGLVTVLGNLIDNALKYSYPDTAVRLSADVVDDQALVTVHNFGPPIAPEHQARVFERFYRVDRSDSRRVYGFGLGLYIARRLVEGMGGRIWVVSEVESGTRFSFTAPLMKEAQLEAAGR